MLNNQMETEVMALTAKELVEELVGLVCENGMPAEKIVVYFDDVLPKSSIFEELAEAEIPFGISFDSVCYFHGVKFIPWKYREYCGYETNYVYLLVEEVF